MSRCGASRSGGLPDGRSDGKSLGRLSFNPLKHLDPVGTIMLLFLVLDGPSRSQSISTICTNKRMGLIIRFLGGHHRQYVFGFLAFFLYRLLSPPPSSVLMTFLYYLAQINIILAAFNLIPIPPSMVQKFSWDSRRQDFNISSPALNLRIFS